MPKEISTPKQGGGGGYTYADKVSALYLLNMLSGRPPLNTETGQIESVRFEKRVDGWFLDDIVLFLRRIDDETAVVAISVKSNKQITKEGISADFTRAVWEQRLHVQTDKFDLNRDYLALATSPLDIDVKSAWDSLLAKAIDADPVEFADRIATPRYDNEIGRAIFASLNCPSEIDSSKTPTDTTNLLKRLRHLQFDFESNPSGDENDCVSRCGELLRDGGIAEAISLWTHLKLIARSLATSGGDLSRTQLADRLRATFSFNEFPNYISDWRKLSDDFSIRIERIRGRLAGKLEISRDDTTSLYQKQKLTAFIGSSGSGKTVLAKNVSVDAAKDGHVIWLTSTDLNLNNISEQFSALGILYRFPELVAQSVGRRGLIVIDGVERLTQEGLANLAVLLRRARVETDSTAWSFIFTCVVDLWSSTFQALKREYGGSLIVEVKTVEFSFNDHRGTVLEAFPNMGRMLRRPNLASLFGNLKILDLVLSNANEETNTTAWVGESNILDWYWEQHIQAGADGVARSRFVQKLACIEADQFLSAVPIDEFGSDECRLATGLKEDQVIWSREERLGFEHDLLGDWARARFLISRRHEIVDVVRDKAFNPRWHRAIRLYGLRLLENQSGDNQQWSELIAELIPGGQHKVESDLVLESVVFAGNAESLLQQVWNRLFEHDGALLARLLTRFLHVASLPDPRYAALSEDVATAAFYRIPFWPLWLPLLRVLYEKRAASISVATDQITQIADLWLKTSGAGWLLRDEAGQILLDASAFMIEEIRLKEWRVDSDLCKNVFSRLLTAAIVCPDEVAELALSLVERRRQSVLIDDAEDELADDVQAPEDEDGLVELWGLKGPLADPWPDGPLRHVNHNVREGFLSGGNPLSFLFDVRPDVAKEVLLALLMREPLPVGHSFGSQLHEFLHVDTVREWTPGMFFRGPFLTFLQTDWEKGIETIVALINFVTQRWLDNREKPPPSVCATIDDETVEYFGSNEAYHWYRGSAQSPNVVVPALMALERWLYLCLEHKEPIKPAVRQVLRSSRSTALLGVLVAVGKKQPEMFGDELRALVPIWQLQVWEEEYRIQQLDSLLGLTMMEWMRWGETIFNMVRDWHAMAHRKTTLGDVLFKQFVANSEFRLFMETVQANWAKEYKVLGGNSDDNEYLEGISLRFDKHNWKARSVENGVVLDFIEPEERKQRLTPIREEDERLMAVRTFPLKCRKLIDERKEMTQEELERFWLQLRSIADYAQQARDHGDIPENAIMGGIAVLVILHEQWLSADSERERWCSEQFGRVLDAPPPHPEFHEAESVSDYFWNNFAAMLIPRILTEDPTHEEVRRLCGEFALAFNYSVIEDLMCFAFECRYKLGDDFRRLQHLIVVSSGIRNVQKVTHDGNSIWNCPGIKFDILAQFFELIERFVKFETPLKLPKLVAVAEKSTDTIVEMVRQQRQISYEEPTAEDVLAIAKSIKRGRGFEPYHLRAGFCWLEKIETVRNSAERVQWIDTLENLIHGFLRPLGGIEEALFDNKDNHTFFTIPGQWDTWIFDLVASVIPKLEENESGHRLWQPILAFGLDRMHWVDSFLSSWFIHGLRVEGCEANFFRVWKAMIAYAWTLHNWRHTEVINHRSDDELYRHLMGFSGSSYGYFKDDKYRSYIASMKPEYERWMEEFFPAPEAISAYANFLTFPSAVDHLREGVRRLAEASSQFQDWHWRDFYHLDSSLLQLLEHDWHANSRLISKDADIRRQFSTILKTMTDRQIPRAMELQDKMIRGISNILL